MARNGSGSYSLSDTLANATTGDADEVNAILQDIADEITNSVAVDGQSTMTAQLKVANGSAATPAIAPGSDTDTGLYRIGANNMGAAANGALVWDWGTGGITLASGKVLGGTDIVDSTQIKANAVTLAKLATQADATVLANVSGVSAVPTAATVTAVLDTISATQGTILYRDASEWTVLSPSTADYALTTQGAGANPVYKAIPALALPSQSGNTGYNLKTDGTNASWSGDSVVRARGTVTVSGTTPTLEAGSVNVASVTRVSGPLYRVTFTTALASTNYQLVGCAEGQGSYLYPISMGNASGNRQTTYCDIQFSLAGVSSNMDPSIFYFVIYGGF